MLGLLHAVMRKYSDACDQFGHVYALTCTHQYAVIDNGCLFSKNIIFMSPIYHLDLEVCHI